jgi:hypothetical protein
MKNNTNMTKLALTSLAAASLSALTLSAAVAPPPRTMTACRTRITTASPMTC